MQTRMLTEEQLDERAFTVLRTLDGLTINEIQQVFKRADLYAINTSFMLCSSSEYQRCEQGFAPALSRLVPVPR